MGEKASCTMFVEVNSQRFPLELGQIYLLGKQLSSAVADIDKCINLREEDDVDQKHCVLEVGVGDDVYIFDLCSSNGTYLNNERLKALEKTRLKNGDIFKVGLDQLVKFYHEQPEMSHDSSGFLEVNKNTSDIIVSSPESTSQREVRMKRLNNNFLVPAVPPQTHITPNTSLVLLETEINTSKNLLNSSVNSRRSDSFFIPETQFCKSRSSINSADLSIAESNPDVNVSNKKFNYLNDDSNDDFCIPETQEVITGPISCSQRPRLLTENKKPKVRGILEEKSIDLDDDSLNGSEFRICTQDYNEGFGEIEHESLTSQIIPIIKHNTVLLTNANKSIKEVTNDTSKLTEEEKEKEMSALQWNDSNLDQQTTDIRANCSTPDIFEIDYLQEAVKQNKTRAAKETVTNKPIFESDPAVFEDEEDLMPTQILPSNNAKPSSSGSNVLNEKENPCFEKEQEDFITLSDKENRCPGDLEPILDLPPTQLLTVNEASSARSSASTSSRKSTASKSEEGLNLNPSTSKAIQNNKLLRLDGDEEDDRLTQAFLQPTKPLSITPANPLLPAKCMNSTLLDDKVVSNKNPAAFFADIEQKTPMKQIKSSLNIFKMPERDFTSLRKTSSAASTNSESDLDLLMCTPQLIKEHIQVEHNDEFKKSLLAAKNKNLFGDDTDEEEDDRNEEKQLLVELINIPKDSKDFDKLLPHLKNNDEHRSKRKSTITEEQKAAKETYKEYKFNVSFGLEQEANKSLNKLATKSRNERHVGRDKERELAMKKEELKNGEKSKDGKTQKKMQKKQSTRKTKVEEDTKTHEETKAEEKPKAKDEQTEPTKQERSTRLRKRLQSSDQPEGEHTDNKNAKKAVKENISKIEKDAKKAKETIKENNSNKEKVNKKAKDTNKDTDYGSVEREPQQMPARRMTRLKSRLNDDKPSTSQQALAKDKSKVNEQVSEPEEDDLDNIPTQRFARSTRNSSNSKHSESQNSFASSTTTSRKTAANRTLQKTSSAVSNNTIANGSVSKTNNERKRKADIPTQQVTIERKRLRSTSTPDLSTIHNTLSTSSSSTVLSISMTMVQPELFQDLLSHSAGLWTVAKNPAESEVLVMDKAYRTFKFLLAMARGIPIVTSEWLKKINETKSLKMAPIKDYIFSDAVFEKKHKFSFINSLKHAAQQKQRIFEDYEFLMTSGILPNPSEMKAIIEAAGGLIHLKSPPPARENQKIYLISSVNDKKDWHKFRRLNKNIIIISTEAIMSAVMRQSCLPLSNTKHLLA